jgi:hypothetical protein
MSTTYSPTDSLRYLATYGREIIESVAYSLGSRDLDEPLSEDETERLIAMLERVTDLMYEHRNAHTDDPFTYDDGRSVRIDVTIEHGYYYEHVWHPEASHADNQPHVVISNTSLYSDTPRDVLVVPGEELIVCPSRYVAA